MINLNIYLNKIILAISICLMLLFTIGWMFAPEKDLSNATQLDKEISSEIGLKQDIHSSSDFDNIAEYEKAEVSENDIIEQTEDNSLNNKNNRRQNLVPEVKSNSDLDTSQDELHAKAEMKTVVEKDNIEIDLNDFEDDTEYYYAEEDIPFIELDGSIVVANE